MEWIVDDCVYKFELIVDLVDNHEVDWNNDVFKNYTYSLFMKVCLGSR